MKSYIIFIFIIPLSILAQSIKKVDNVNNKVVPIFGLEFDFTSYTNSSSLVLLNKYSLSGGVQMFDKMDVSLNIGFVNTQHLINGLNKKIEAFSGSLNLNYRFFKNYWVSPSVRFDIGTILNSNAKNKFVNGRLEISETEQSGTGWSTEYYNRFSSWGINYSTQAFISFKLKNIYLEIGLGYSRQNYFTESLLEKDSDKNSLNGLKLCSGLKYRFKK